MKTGAGTVGQPALFEEHGPRPAHGQIAKNADSGGSAADDDDSDRHVAHTVSGSGEEPPFPAGSAPS